MTQKKKEELPMKNYRNVRLLDFTQFGDERGHLVVVEGSHDIPFDIKIGRAHV